MRHSTDTDPLARAVGTAIDAYLQDSAVPGVSVAITTPEDLILEQAAGFAEIASATPMRGESLFEIGSIGKTFTALVILQLEAAGRLLLDDPVVRHLPWFRVPRTGSQITIRHLLSHTAGITAGIDGSPEPTSQVWRLRHLRPGSAPGRRMHYSNVGYKTLGLIIEAIEHRPYPEVLTRRILGPLGMAASAPAITNAIRPSMAVGYGPAIDDRPWQDGDSLAPATWLETDTADGSVAATAADMAVFLRALMLDTDGHVARMTTPVPALGAYGYGLGLFRREVDGRTFCGHGGGMVGYLSGMQWDPDTRVGAIVLQNGPGGAPNALARLLVRQATAAMEDRDPSGEVLESLGDDGEVTADPSAPSAPTDAQSVLVGTYRSHDPWTPVFRIEARGEPLWLVFPSAPDGFDDEQILVPMAAGWWRVGSDRLGPERLRFDTIIDDRARRASLSGWDYYRVAD